MLQAAGPEDAGCLLLDVRLPGMDGLTLQSTLIGRGVALPIIFISGHGDIPMAVEAVSAGTLDFVEKPFNEAKLLERIHAALRQDREARQRTAGQDLLDQRLGRLTSRERQLMEGMLAGRLNKLIASDLGASVRTVEIHRARVLDKLEARNAPELVRLVLSSRAYRHWLL
ncbi:MAG: response regulator transcription factor [Halorhodospira sp.]